MKRKYRDVVAVIILMVIAILVVINYKGIISLIAKLFKAVLPVFLGVVFAFILNKPYIMLDQFLREKFKVKDNLSKIISITLVYIVLIGVIVLIICTLVPTLVENIVLFSNNFDDYVIQIMDMVNKFLSFFDLGELNYNEIINAISNFLNTIDSYVDEITPQLLEGASSFISVLANIGIGLILSVYMLFSKNKLLRECQLVINTYVPEKIINKIKDPFYIVLEVFDNYIWGQVIEAFILGALCFIGLILFRIDYAGLIALIVGLTALVPILGAYIGGIIGALLLLFSNPEQAVIFVIFLVILQQFEGNVIYPRVVGNKIGLPALWVLIGITIGGELGGILGIFLGVPITTLFYNFLRQDVINKNQQISNNVDDVNN